MPEKKRKIIEIYVTENEEKKYNIIWYWKYRKNRISDKYNEDVVRDVF